MNSKNPFNVPGIKPGSLTDRLAKDAKIKAAKQKEKFLLDTLRDKVGAITQEEVDSYLPRLSVQTIQLTDTRQQWRLHLDGKVIGITECEVGFVGPS